MAEPPPDGRRTPRSGESSSGCALLVPYSLSICTEEEELEFESHMLSCDRCFEDLRSIDRTRALVRRFLGASPVALETALVLQKQRHRVRLLLLAGAGVLAFALGFVLAQLI